MKKKLVSVAIISMILVMTVQVTSAYTFDANQQTIPIQSPPKQKISPYLQEQINEALLNTTVSRELIRILIRYNPDAKPKLPNEIKILKEFRIIPLISAMALPSAIEEIAQIKGVEYIYPDMKVEATVNGGLPEYPFPYNPWLGNYPCFLNESTALIGADDLWADGITGEGVIIAILDTGINKYHPDLDDLDDDPTTCDPKVIAEAAFIEEPSWEVGDPHDYHGHGTHCASIAAGTGATGGMGFYGTFFYSQFFNTTILPGTERGVAPGAYLYNAKVLNSYGYGYDSWIVAGIEWAVERGADVISMSLGGWPIFQPDEDPLVLALTTAIEHGVVCVVAAGNSGWGYFTLDSPGFAPAVITVGATTETDELALFSSRGPEQYGLCAKPDILAPGTCMVAAFAGFDDFENYYDKQFFYLEISGTSMATPHVAGAAALLLEAFPGASPYSIKSAIMLGADDLGLDPMAQGAGRLNVALAYELMSDASTEDWSAPIPTNTVIPAEPTLMWMPNLTDIDILVETDLCSYWKMSAFLSVLASAGATVSYGSGPYFNDSLVDPMTLEPLYDIFIIPEPYFIDDSWLPPSVLAHYLEHDGTILFTGDYPQILTEYNVWTEQWGIIWDNTAVGGVSTNFAPHAITSGIQSLYFGSPVASLILNTSVTPSPECVVWDPILPGVAVWEAESPSTGKVVVISDDGILSDQYLASADNIEFGFNIIKWFTGAPDMYLSGVEFPLVPPVESPHPYPPDADLWYPITAPGAEWISVHFKTIDVEEGYDYITIYDQFMNPIGYYTGHYRDVWSNPVFGDTLWIRLQSDSIIEWWGFLADAYMYGTISSGMFHEIGVGGTWEKYVIANVSFIMTVDVYNFGNYTEDVMLSMSVFNQTGFPVVDDWNFANVTVAPGETVSVDVTPDVILNATTICDFAGTHPYDFLITGDIYKSSSGSPPYPEIDYTNNMFSGTISAVPKTPRSGPNPLLTVLAPMKIDSTSAPLIAMYPNDFALHNITAFVGGGTLANAEFRITGAVAAIADFVNVTTFVKHHWGDSLYGWIIDPSPSYFIPNMTAIIGDTLEIGDVSAPAMLFAELQIYIAEDVPVGTYTGSVQLVDDTGIIASIPLTFEVRTPKSRVLWEDYFNDYRVGMEGEYWGSDCERLWAGAFANLLGNGSLGVFEWWKTVAAAGFDVDSLHQQLYFNEHLGYLGTHMKDPMQVIAYGGYDIMCLHDVEYPFSAQEISVFQQLYESGEMGFVVLFNHGSEDIDFFITNYGISYTTPYMGPSPPSPPSITDMIITGIDKTHPIFQGVENFTLSTYPYESGYFLRVGPYLWGEDLVRCEGEAKGIATGTDDFGLYDTSGFVVAVNELQATPHIISRMAVVADGNMFESLEYEDFLIWINLFILSGNNTIVSRVDTDKFAVNMLEWLIPQFVNTAPTINYATVTPTTVKPGDTANVDLVASDPENDEFTVTIAVKNPNGTWNNMTVSEVGGHWLREFTTDQVGSYRVYAVVTDEYGASIVMPIGTVDVINNPPAITTLAISPRKVVQGEKVFITVGAEDLEDNIVTEIKLSITAPDGSIVANYTFSNTNFANAVFDATGMEAGVYNVNVTVVDSQGAETTANIGVFEVKIAPMVLPIMEIGLGVGIVALIALIAIALMLWRRPLSPAPKPA